MNDVKSQTKHNRNFIFQTRSLSIQLILLI